MKLTWKQIDKYVYLCERFKEQSQLGNIEYTIVCEQDAESMGGWYGPGNDKKPGSMYIVILPDGSSHS